MKTFLEFIGAINSIISPEEDSMNIKQVDYTNALPEPNDLKLNGILATEVSALLQIALAEELNAWYQYLIVTPFATGNERSCIVETFKEHAKDELEDHAYWLMERINLLGCTPELVLSPANWDATANHKYIVPNIGFNVIDLLKQNIEAEKGAIETYTNIELQVRDKDIVTYTKIKEILADEQEHLANLQDLLKDIMVSQ